MEMLKKMFDSKKFWYAVSAVLCPFADTAYQNFFESNIFWYAVSAVLCPFAAAKLGLSEAEVEKVYYAILTLILGQGIADIKK